MAKRFNITGTCYADEHYMADVSAKWEAVYRMVESGEYFTINRPRQYGKTTTLYALATHFRQKADYLVFNMSFEGIGDVVFEQESVFSVEFVGLLSRHIKKVSPDLSQWLSAQESGIKNLEDVSNLITDLAEKTSQKLLLIIDEVDKSSNNQLFVSFLAMLRNKYLVRREEKTFYSVVLAGLYDVKSLKLKLRAGTEAKYNSPWNIATEFKVDMNLQVAEIKPMLVEYAEDKGVQMDTQVIAERLFYYTSGYPFLVSKLCKMLDEKDVVLQREKTWVADDIENAVKQLVKEHNTNFDSLAKHLENNAEVYDLVYQIAVDGQQVIYSVLDPVINLTVQYGILVEKNNRLVIHNRIYNEVLVNYMTAKFYRLKMAYKPEGTILYQNADNSLNMAAILRGFQSFMKKEYNKKDRDFLEKNGRLVFLAFLKPIINGGGYDFKEPQVSDEKRLDIAVTYFDAKFIVELKLWRGTKYHEKGLKQLEDYLETQNLEEGYLVIFDHSEVKNWHAEWLNTEGGKKVFAVWV